MIIFTRVTVITLRYRSI